MFLRKIKLFIVKSPPILCLLRYMLVFCSIYSSTLKIEGICTSKITADFRRTTRRYIGDNRIPREKTNLSIFNLTSARVLICFDRQVTMNSFCLLHTSLH
jgi:hypothetical protein